MTLRHFKIFMTVCDKMSMTAAAEDLFMSQSAVSQAIADLERHYSVRLFERLSRKLFLTKAGQKLQSYGRHIVNINTEVERDMKTLRHNGSIRIGASVTVGSYILPKIISSFGKSNPKADIEVFEDNTAVIENMILKDQIDIALVEGETTSSDVLSYEFMEDELVLICSTHHRFAGLNIIEPAELEAEKFIIREKGSGTRKTFEDKMLANNLKWKATWTCNNSDTIKMAVMENQGVAVISKRAVVNEIENGLLYQTSIKGIEFKRQFKIIYHRNKYLTQSIKDFIVLCTNS